MRNGVVGVSGVIENLRRERWDGEDSRWEWVY